MTHDPGSISRFDDIPDPAASVAQGPIPEAKLPDEVSLTRAGRARWSMAALMLSIGWILAAAWFAGLRHDLGAPRVMVALGLWALLCSAGLFVTLRPRQRGLPAGLRVLQTILVALPAGFLVSALITSDTTAEDSAGVFPCLWFANLIALGPLILAALVLRRTFLSSPAWRGAAIGAVCGLGGSFGVHAHCPVAASAHVLLAHGLPILAGVLFGAAAGSLQGRV